MRHVTDLLAANLHEVFGNRDPAANLQWQVVDLGTGCYRLVNRTHGMVADGWGSTHDGAPAQQAPWNYGPNQQRMKVAEDHSSRRPGPALPCPAKRSAGQRGSVPR